MAYGNCEVIRLECFLVVILIAVMVSCTVTSNLLNPRLSGTTTYSDADLVLCKNDKIATQGLGTSSSCNSKGLCCVPLS